MSPIYLLKTINNFCHVLPLTPWHAKIIKQPGVISVPFFFMLSFNIYNITLLYCHSWSRVNFFYRHNLSHRNLKRRSNSLPPVIQEIHTRGGGEKLQALIFLWWFLALIYLFFYSAILSYFSASQIFVKHLDNICFWSNSFARRISDMAIGSPLPEVAA